MGFLGIGGNIQADTELEITEGGNKVAERYDAGTPAIKILAILRQGQRPMSVSELAREADMDVNTVKKQAELLKRKRMVMVL